MNTMKSKLPDPTAPDAAPVAAPLPLAVDLDGTLLLTDTLFEAIAVNLRTRPLWTLFQMMMLPFALAATKRRIQAAATLDLVQLPVNQDVLAYCREASAEGRPVWLASAADQSVVDGIAARFPGVFSGALGSDGRTNNKSGAKARALQKLFPNGFEYIGDSPADHKVWAVAKAASVVGGGKTRQAAIKSSGDKIARTFTRPAASLKAWRKALRLHQWAKNGLIFVAPILANQLFVGDTFVRCILAFVFVGLMASGTYLLNDILDLAADRAHHSKHKRPFAAGVIKLWQGFVAAPILILVGFIGGFILSPSFAVTMASYLVITLSYSMMLKRLPLLDAMILGCLFTLRLVMGGVIAAVPVTQWLIIFSMFLFFSLSLAKRHVEVIRKAALGETRVANRGYRAEDATLTLGLGLATATASPIILVLYLIDSAWPSGAYTNPTALWVAPVILSIWLMRVWLLANRAELDDDPVTFAVHDPQSLALGAFLAAAFAYAAFAPHDGFLPEGWRLTPPPAAERLPG